MLFDVVVIAGFLLIVDMFSLGWFLDVDCMLWVVDLC